MRSKLNYQGIWYKPQIKDINGYYRLINLDKEQNEINSKKQNQTEHVYYTLVL